MRLPVKLNDHSWPRFLRWFVGRNLCRDPRVLVPGFGGAIRDPAVVSEAISNFKFGTTFKSTESGRHSLSDQLLIPHCRPDSVILDVGASDGITAAELIAKLGANFSHYFATDKNLRTHAQVRERTTYFYDPEGTCILIADDRFVYYPQESHRLERRFAPHLKLTTSELVDLPTVELLNPSFLEIAERDPRVKCRAFSAFSPWPEARPTAVKIANVLNADYFSDKQITTVLRNLHSILVDEGLLLVVENREVEQGALYRKSADGYIECARLERGVDIHRLIVET